MKGRQMREINRHKNITQHWVENRTRWGSLLCQRYPALQDGPFRPPHRGQAPQSAPPASQETAADYTSFTTDEKYKDHKHTRYRIPTPHRGFARHWSFQSETAEIREATCICVRCEGHSDLQRLVGPQGARAGRKACWAQGALLPSQLWRHNNRTLSGIICRLYLLLLTYACNGLLHLSY